MDEAIFISQNRYTGAHNQGSHYSTESPSIEARSKPKVKRVETPNVGSRIPSGQVDIANNSWQCLNSGEVNVKSISQREREKQRDGTRLFNADMFTRDPGRDRPALRLVTDDLGIGTW
ncbi:hypothetical protein N7527_000528 [Penicillium freii]|nr:hypothetical protein N7527_000528 [Penicillium freii]